MKRCGRCCWTWVVRGDYAKSECPHCGAQKDERFAQEGDAERAKQSQTAHKIYCIRRTR